MMSLRIMARQIKWARQRLSRGWDDRVLWGIDYYLAVHMPQWLAAMKVKGGLPSWCFDNCNDNSKESWDKAQNRWNEVIDKMIDGWNAAKEITDSEFVDYESSLARYKAGMSVFTEHLFDLWD